MAKRIHLTKPTVAQLPPAAPGKRAYFNDDVVRGLQIAVTDRGAKSYYLYRKVGGKPQRILLGRHPDIAPERARRLAEREIGKIAAGRDPNAEKKAARARSVALGAVLEAYLETRGSLKPKTAYNYRLVVESVLADWRDKPVAEITKDMVAARHTRIGKERGESYANQTMRVLRALLNFASARWEDPQGRPLLPENPVKRLSQTRAWYPSRRRTTVIKIHELPAWLKAVQALKAAGPGRTAHTVADFLLLLLFTGLRRGEAARLTWDDIDLKGRTLTIADTKNAETHVLPLSDFLFELLSARKTNSHGDFVFPRADADRPLVEPRKQMAHVINASGVAFTLHDLRRTFITIAESLDIPAYALKRLLNHKMRNDVTAGYIITDVERLRRPIQLVTDFILRSARVQDGAQVVVLNPGKEAGPSAQ